MKTKILIVLIFSIALFSCTSLMKVYYGITKPQVESTKSLMKYANRKGLNTKSIVFINPDSLAIKKFASNLPDAYFFNSKGIRFAYNAYDTACNASVFNFIENLNKTDSQLNFKYDISFSHFLNSVCNENSKSIVLEEKNVDFYLFISWRRFIGRLNKDHTREWQHLAAQNKNATIKVFLLNSDVLDTWNKDKILEFKKTKMKMH